METKYDMGFKNPSFGFCVDVKRKRRKEIHLKVAVLTQVDDDVTRTREVVIEVVWCGWVLGVFVKVASMGLAERMNMGCNRMSSARWFPGLGTES